MRKHRRRLDASVEAPSARFPKFVHPCGTLFRELRKAKGTSKILNSSAAFDLKFLFRTRGNLDRNFKSAALVSHDFTVHGIATRRLATPCPSRPTFVTIAIRPLSGVGRAGL